MLSLIKNMLAARNNGWEQLIFIIIVFAVPVLKGIFSGLKNMSSQTASNKDKNKEEPPQQKPANRKHVKYTYEHGAFKTIEQLREEKIAQIRAVYGIPEPQTVETPQTEIPEYVPKIPDKKAVYAAKQNIKKTEIHQPNHTKAKHIESDVHPSETLIHLSSRQDLRSAILYQEILGPPVSMR